MRLISQSSPTDTIEESDETVVVSKRELNALIDEIKSIKTGQELQMQQIKEFMVMVQAEFKALRREMNINQKNVNIDITYKPPIINNIDDLNKMEEKLGRLDESFIKEYTQMV
jgi:inorganic pyrophosphatase